VPEKVEFELIRRRAEKGGIKTMSQNIYNFVVPTSTPGVPFVLDPRVFDSQISANSQAYYETLLTALQGSIDSVEGGTGSTANAASDVQQLLNALNAWSQMEEVNGAGQQVYGPGVTNGVGGSSLATTTVGSTPGATPVISLPAITLSTGQVIQANNLTTTMNQYMASSVDNLTRTIRSAGWDPINNPTPGDGSDTAALTTLLTGTGPQIYNVDGLLTQGLSAASQAMIIGDATTQSNSLQQVLMVDYIQQGNDILYNEMSQLQSAINVNNNALSYLNSLQDLMNQKDPQQFLMQLQTLSTTNLSTLGDTQYNSFEQQTFNQTLGTVPKFTDSDAASYITALTNSGTDGLAQGAFQTLSNTMTQSYTYSVTQIQSNLTYLIQQLQGQGAAGSSLQQSLTQIQNDFTAAQTASPSAALNTWIQDITNGTEGNYQNDLNNAIVASQAFNDTERTNLQQVMFVFEEFYKSATDMLSRLTQLIEKMGDAINR